MIKKLLILVLPLFLIGFSGCKSKTTTKATAETETFETATCAKACGGCNSAQTANLELENPDELKVIYFHATRRCATCEAVEKETKQALNDAFGDNVVFTSLNREEDINKAMVEKFGIAGQTLLLIKGDSVVNFTNTAFLMARTAPEDYKAKFTETAKALKAL